MARSRSRSDPSPLRIAEASERMLADIRPLDIERLPLRQALGRVLAEDITATVTTPPWSNSSMDGYAVRSADITPMMTGAPIPDGADSVIRKEDTDGGVERVEVRDARDVWKNIRPAGEDFQRGDVLAKRGSPLKAAVIGVLASTGAKQVNV